MYMQYLRPNVYVKMGKEDCILKTTDTLQILNEMS